MLTKVRIHLIGFPPPQELVCAPVSLMMVAEKHIVSFLVV